MTIHVEKEPLVDEFDETCYMIQGINSLEVYSETHLDDNTSSSGDDHVDVDALKYTLSKEHISLIFHCDFAFAVWNTLTSPKEQTTYVLEKEPHGG